MSSPYATALHRAEQRLSETARYGYDVATEQFLLANLYNLFPAMGWDSMSSAVRQCALNQERAVLDLHHGAELLREISVEDPHGVAEAGRPAVFVGSHFAGYRLIAPLLIARGHALTVVMDAQVASAQGASFTHLFETYRRANNIPADRLRIRDTSEAGVVLGMARDLRQGRSLLLYIDANRGANTPGERIVEVPFLTAKLRSRTGIPVVATMAGAPIVPVSMKRGDTVTSNRAVFGAPLDPRGEDREAFVRRALHHLWGGIAAQVAADPTQWESLRYVHEHLLFEGEGNRAEGGPLRFNRSRFALGPGGRRGELFDRKTYSIVPIRNKLLDLLEKMSETSQMEGVASLGLEPDVLGWLKDQEFIVGEEGTVG